MVSTLRLASLRSKARVYAPDDVRRLLGDATGPDLALCIDVDALERSQLARVDGVTLLALGALREYFPIALLAWDAADRASMMKSALPGSIRCTHAVPRPTLAPVRAALPGRRLIVLTDTEDFVSDLTSGDSALLLGAPAHLVSRNVARIRELEVRATLWWLAEHAVQWNETLKATSRNHFR